MQSKNNSKQNKEKDNKEDDELNLNVLASIGHRLRLLAEQQVRSAESISFKSQHTRSHTGYLLVLCNFGLLFTARARRQTRRSLAAANLTAGQIKSGQPF